MDKRQIYVPNWTVLYYRYWSGIAVFIFAYFLICIVTPLIEVFESGLIEGVNKFIEFNQDFFSYSFIYDIKWISIIGFFIVLQIICYFDGGNSTKRVYLYKDCLETILFNKKLTRVNYSDIEKVSCNYYKITLNLRNKEQVFIPNNMKDYRKLYDSISEKVKSLGGKVKEIDEE